MNLSSLRSESKKCLNITAASGRVSIMTRFYTTSSRSPDGSRMKSFKGHHRRVIRLHKIRGPTRNPVGCYGNDGNFVGRDSTRHPNPRARDSCSRIESVARQKRLLGFLRQEKMRARWRYKFRDASDDLEGAGTETVLCRIDSKIYGCSVKFV